MANLKGLIRVRKHAVEQKQKFLAELYRQAEQLKDQKTRLLDQLEKEEDKVKEMDVEMLSYFGPYSEAVKGRVEDIDHAAKILETRISIAQDDMRAAFAEMKKIEITDQRRMDEAQAALDKKESTELDEAAIEGFRRRVIEESKS